MAIYLKMKSEFYVFLYYFLLKVARILPFISASYKRAFQGNSSMILESKMSNTLRFLSADMVQRANSGHPGVAMGLSDILTILSKHLIHNPKNPKWINRDRLIFSGGHASALLYSFLHLSGYDVSLQDLKNFRQLGSKTAGHPEYGLIDGVEITTGPLGQGVANAVGFAMAAKYAQNLLGKNLINHKVYCFCGDGDLQEGISYEACSLAGLHKLNNLILIYDSNNITIEGEAKIAFDEDIKKRFLAQNFAVIEIDGHNFTQIDSAFIRAKKAKKPTIIIAKTTIAKGALELEGSHKSHGAPLGSEILSRAKRQAAKNGEFDGEFVILDDVKVAFESVIEVGEMKNKLWDKALKNSRKEKLLESLQNPRIDSITFPQFHANDYAKGIATRTTNGIILNAISQSLGGFIGGSADLAPSNNTALNNQGDFPQGKNLHFGIREHSMGAICNAFAAYGLFMPFCATFFVFSDYMSAAVRIAAISKLRVFYIWTHDSICVGEDGATHQPIEQISHFRSMPNLLVFRPADANENVACWEVALSQNLPCAFVLSRQNLPVLESKNIDCKKGAYILKDFAKNGRKITILSSGSEVHIALDSAKILESSGISVRVVSVPCYDLFIAQSEDFIAEILGGDSTSDIKIFALEAGRGLEWYRFADEVIAMQSFGASGKGEAVLKHFGFSAESVAKTIKEKL